MGRVAAAATALGGAEAVVQRHRFLAQADGHVGVALADRVHRGGVRRGWPEWTEECEPARVRWLSEAPITAAFCRFCRFFRFRRPLAFHYGFQEVPQGERPEQQPG